MNQNRSALNQHSSASSLCNDRSTAANQNQIIDRSLCVFPILFCPKSIQTRHHQRLSSEHSLHHQQWNTVQPPPAAPFSSPSSVYQIKTLPIASFPHNSSKMTEDVEMKEQRPAPSNSVTSTGPSTMQHLKEIALLIETSSYTHEVCRIVRAVRLTIALRRKLKASVVSTFLNFAVVPRSNVAEAGLFKRGVRNTSS